MFVTGPCHQSIERDFTLDPDHYMSLSRRQKWRKIGYTFRPDLSKTDSELHGPRWYRFGGKLPDTRVEDESCGTQYPAWIRKDGHPTPEDGIVDRVICFGKDCRQETEIKVAACNIESESFYIYRLQKTLDNDSGYCYE